MGNKMTTLHSQLDQRPSKKERVKPPNEWNEQSENKRFVTVSPMSDISNPSQFRHRQSRKGSTKTPLQDRKRTSKVMSKTLPPPKASQKNQLPAPASFYFDRSLSVDDIESVQPRRNVKDWVRKKHEHIKAKASKAKQMLQGCWEEHKENFLGCVQSSQIIHERFKSLSPADRASLLEAQPEGYEFSDEIEPIKIDRKLQSRALPQQGVPKQVYFQPALQGDSTILTEPPQETENLQAFMHDADDYVERMVDERKSSIKFSPNRTVHVALPEAENHSSDGRQNMKTTTESPVAALFPYQQFAPYGDHEDEHRDVTIPLYSKSLHSGDTERPGARQPVNSGPREKSTGTAADRKSIEDALQKQVDAQLQHNPERPRGRLSTTATIDARVEAKLEIEKQNTLGRKDGRVNRLRESYLNELNKLKSKSYTLAKSRMSTESLPTKLHRMAEVEMSKPARMSEPTRGRSIAREQPLRGRSDLFDRRSHPESKEIPVLLQMAGWGKPAQTTDGQKRLIEPRRVSDLPAVLKLAGWKESHTVNDHLVRRVSTETVPVDVKENKANSAREHTKPSRENPESLDETSVGHRKERDQKSTDNIQQPDHSQKERYSLPGASIKQLLLATYPISKAFSHPMTAKPVYRSNLAVAGHSVSPASSVESNPASSICGPSISEQATCNAAFLFSPSYADGKESLSYVRVAPKASSSFSISTLDSRSRLTTTSATRSQSITVSTKIASIDEASIESDRRVRFSDGHQVIPFISGESSYRKLSGPKEVAVPCIENKLSDLTDLSNNERDSLVSNASSKSYCSKITTSPIMEETVDHLVESSLENSTVAIFEDRDSQDQEVFRTQWSYSAGNPLDTGVTPLRSGKTATHVTNSPSLRFNEARKTFSNAVVKKKNSPVKHAAPRGQRSKGGLVSTRIQAVEERVTKVASNAYPLKTRRDTIGHSVIAPRKGRLVSAQFNATLRNKASTLPSESTDNSPFSCVASDESQGPGVSGFDADKFTSSACETSNSQIGAGDLENHTLEADCGSDEKAARDIVRDVIESRQMETSTKIFDESTDYDTDDDFAQILNYQNSGDFGDSEYDEDTVSTVRQVRLLKDGSSIATSGSSTVDTVPKRRSVDSDTMPLSRVLSQERPTLPFREQAPVKPSEQNHRAGPGSLCLSPMQRTPMQAMKWRSLAVAAHEQDQKRTVKFGSKTKTFGRGPRKSLAERHPNLVG